MRTTKRNKNKKKLLSLGVHEIEHETHTIRIVNQCVGLPLASISRTPGTGKSFIYVVQPNNPDITDVNLQEALRSVRTRPVHCGV